MSATSQQFNYATLPLDSTAIDAEVFVAFTLDGEEVEEYRTLRTQLSLRWFNQHKSLLFTSTREGHGNSHVVANLAILFSQLGHKTLLVDANIRRPAQHSLFRLDQAHGLSDLLANNVKEDVIHSVSGFNNLSVLTAGTTAPNPLELLSVKQFWVDVEQHYDVILIDTPPALDYTDAQLIASQVGGAVVVARNNETRVADLQKVEALFDIANAETVGVVLKNF